MNSHQQDTNVSAKNFKSDNTTSAKAALKATTNNTFTHATGLPEDIVMHSEQDLKRYESFAETLADQHCDDQGHINKVQDHQEDTEETWQHSKNDDLITDIITQLTTTVDTAEEDQCTGNCVKHVQAPANVIVPPTPDFMTQEQLPHSINTDMCRPCHEDDTTTPVDNLGHRTCMRVSMETHKSQSDAGANRHLTNRKEVIKDFKPCTPFNMGTIEEDTTVKVTGSGTTSMQTMDPQKPLIHETLCSPKASGSAFSPEKHANNNKDVI